MKVLCLTNNLDRPEAHLMLGLQKRGLELTLVMDEKSPFQEIVKDSGINIHYHKFKGRISLASIAYLRSLFKRDSFQIAHSFNARALTSAIIASSGLTVKHVAYRGTVGHLSRLDPTAIISFFHPRLSRVICVSDAVKRYMLSKCLSAEKVVRIYKGHSADWYDGLQPVQLSEFDIPSGAFTVACSANMRPVKGVDVLIEAFHYIPPQIPIQLLLIGEIRDDKIKRELANHPRAQQIHTTGFRPDAPSIVKNCDLFCMPSREREGLPKALIEAMIQSVPSIVTNVGGMPEIVSDGLHGLVVPPDNPQMLASAILRLFDEPELRAKMSANARARILDNFSIDATISQTYDLYKGCLAI